MRYLHCRFRDAGVFPYNSGSVPDNRIWDNEKKEYRYASGKEAGAVNYAIPVTANIVANFLRKMCGDIPVPTLRPTHIQKNPIFEEVALKSFIKYDLPRVDKDGRPLFMETIQTSKAHKYNSEKQLLQHFTLFDGTVLTTKGQYTWNYFDRTFMENKDIIIDFINEVIGDDCRKYVFDTMVKMISKYWNDGDFKKSVNDFIKNNNMHINKPWMNVLFGWYRGEKLGCNTIYTSKNPLLECMAIGKIMKVSGDIYLPVNDKMIDSISSHQGFASILDGGTVYVIGLENWDEECLMNKGYEKIITRDEAINICKSMNW